MKLTVEKNQLVQSLTVVSKGMTSRSTLPMLSSIHLEAQGGDLVFRTTDLEISIKHSIPVLVEDVGATVVPGKLFSDIIKSLPDAAVTLEQQLEGLKISCLESSFVVHTLNPADFPLFPEINPTRRVILPAKTLASMVKKVAKAASKDESRATLTGILLKIEGDDIQLAATDSYRLAIARNKLTESTTEELSIIVPSAVLEEISRLISAEEAIEIGESENQIVFNFNPTTFITRKIEGSYPNYEAIIPTEKNCTATIETEVLLAAVKRASITAAASAPVKFALIPELQSMEVSSNTQDVASANEKLAAQIEGEGLEIGFNHQYIIDGLASIDTEELLFEAQNSLKPGIFKSVGDDYYFYLTMPVRLDR
jgi:DNA polymerase-3 subunit beta